MPALLMESLFKLTELESRISLNMNVLSKGKVPKVMDLAEVLKEWLDHRREVLVRRSKHRLAQIDHRLEVLGGLLVAYLNLDKVIKIIRNEDEPKPVLMKTFKLSATCRPTPSSTCGCATCASSKRWRSGPRTRSCAEEKTEIEKLIRSEKEQWKTVADQIKEVRETFGKKTPLGKRRTDFAEAPEHDEAAIEEAMVVREPITVVVSEKGWIRALRGHQADISGIAFKADDGPKFAFPAETTSKILVFATNGRFYTIDASKLPGGRGHGEPVRLYADMEQDAELVSAFRYQSGRKFLVASKTGRGFVVAEDECLANTRKGKQVLNVKPPDKAARDRDGRGRAGGRGRREPQDGDLPARSGAGDGARARRAAAAPQGRRAVRRDDLQGQRRTDLGRRRRPRLQPFAEGACRLARQPRRRRPGAAGPLPRQSEIRPAAGERQERRRRGRRSNVSRAALSEFVTAGRVPAMTFRVATTVRWDLGCPRHANSAQLTTNTIERSDFSRIAVAVSPKNSFSPGRRSTPITIRLCLRFAISLRMASSAAVLGAHRGLGIDVVALAERRRCP